MAHKVSATVATFCTMVASVTLTEVRAESDNVAFPANYTEGVIYTSHDLANAKEFREFYITPAALAAARNGQPLPSGTVITLARYNVQLDDRGDPVKDANGRFVKTELKAFRVMEKHTGWGSDFPPSKRNGEWEYQAFLPDGSVDKKVDVNSCFQCHQNGDSTNFMFTAEQLKSAAK